jgi:hypothetical protein
MSDQVEQAIDLLERRVASLPERPMRRSVLVEALDALDAANLVAWLRVLAARAGNGQARARGIMVELALLPSVFDDLPYSRRQEAYALAQSAGLTGVARLFLSGDLDDTRSAGGLPPENRHVDAPAGVRRAAARTPNRFVLDRLLHDPDPRVVLRLLENPRIVERDVVKMAALRPGSPAVLSTIAEHPRWSGSYRVRTALACNPATPSAIAERLLPTLMRQDLRTVAEAGALPPDRLNEALRLLGETSRSNNGPLVPDAEVELLAATELLTHTMKPLDE